jgi:hypothetical protein
LATTREDQRRWKGSSPETLKRLAISVFLRRSFLPSRSFNCLPRQAAMGFWALFKEAVGPYDHLNECNRDFTTFDNCGRFIR